MKNIASKPASNARSSRLTAGLGVLSCSLLVAAGALVLSSCATTPQGVQREELAFVTVSNGIARVGQIAPYLPPPANGILEGVLAVGGALLAVWASHLHRSVANLENKNSQLASPTPPGEAKTP